ncbi:MAG: cytochrome P450 [Hyphomicrobiaceae bacterium]
MSLQSKAVAQSHAIGPSPVSRLKPHTIVPPARAPGKLGFVARFVRNPLLVVPQPVYEQDFVAYSGGARPLVWVTEPTLIKTILLDERDAYQKLAQIRLLSPLLGKGILTSEGADWKWQRQTSAPMFRHQEVMSFVPEFVRASDDMLARWRQAEPGAVHLIDQEMTRVTFDVISATLLPSADHTVGVAVERSTAHFLQAGAWAQLYAITNMPRWLPRPGRTRMELATRQLRDAVAAMLKEHRASDADRDDLMGRLMRSRDPETGQLMNEEQLIDNLLTFYLAGHETTAKALTWTLYILSQSPEWTAALAEEIARVAGGQPISAAHIDQLVLTGQVVKESMRLYPPVPMVTRQAVRDARLGPHDIKAGTSIVMPIYAIHRHRKRWQDPEVFDPSRFAPDKEGAISRYQYMPFGAGPRICIGMAFALVEATAILARILQHARFEAPAGYVPTPIGRVTLMPKGGMPLKVTML